MAITEPNKGRTAPPMSRLREERRALNRHDLVRRATAILDDYGIADLTMRRLARELDIAPSALYWHFANKQQLLGAVADHVLAPLAESDRRDAPWQERIDFLCSALRDALLSHKDGAELVSASFASGQTAHMITVLDRLAEAAATAAWAQFPPPSPPVASSITCSATSPMSSRGCNGTPRAPLRTVNRSSRTARGSPIPARNSVSARAFWWTGSASWPVSPVRSVRRPGRRPTAVRKVRYSAPRIPGA